jgi:hypothetical protein
VPYSFSLPKGKDSEKMDKQRGRVLAIELVCDVGSGTTINGKVAWNCARVRKRQ